VRAIGFGILIIIAFGFYLGALVSFLTAWAFVFQFQIFVAICLFLLSWILGFFGVVFLAWAGS